MRYSQKTLFLFQFQQLLRSSCVVLMSMVIVFSSNKVIGNGTSNNQDKNNPPLCVLPFVVPTTVGALCCTIGSWHSRQLFDPLNVGMVIGTCVPIAHAIASRHVKTQTGDRKEMTTASFVLGGSLILFSGLLCVQMVRLGDNKCPDSFKMACSACMGFNWLYIIGGAVYALTELS